jgi:hypothetical protein
MLTLNEILIYGTASSISEIKSAIEPSTVAADILNYHKFASDKSLFKDILFPQEDISKFDFEWAYIESCESIGEKLSIIGYSWNGSLIGWTNAIVEKYGIEFEAVIRQCVKTKNYGIDEYTKS